MGNETRQDTPFFTKNKKNREKNWKNRIIRNTETRFLQGFGKYRKRKQVFNEILGNAENKNKNNVFSNVTKQRFESKNEVSVQA